jgi:ApaG protein
MVQEVTDGVSVTVESFYQPKQSNPVAGEYLFAYRITIENLSTMPVKLLRRHWHIKDSNGSYREVEGEGVVGQQPVVEPGDSYQYVSACNLRTDLGTMWGTYTMEKGFNKEIFDVIIPKFAMIAPQKLN